MKFQTIKLEELFEIPTKNGLTRPSRDRGIGFKMVNMGELFANDIIRDIPMELVEMNPTEQKNFNLQNEDLLFARQSIVAEGAGKCSIVDNVKELTTFESHLIRVRLNKKICNPWFYFYYFASPLSPMKSIIMQGVQAGIKASDLKDLDVIFPSLEDQNKVSYFFRNIDELIFNNSQSVLQLNQIIESLYREWFINFKFPNHEQVEFVDGIPEGWLNTPLKQVMSTNPSTLKKGELDEILYVDISSVGQGKIESFTQYHIDDAPGRAKRKVQHGDVIWSCVRPNRKQYALIQNPQTNLIVSTGFTVLRSTKIPFTYLTALAASDDFCGYLTSVAQGAAYPAVTYKDFEDYELLLPPKSLLDKFHEVVEPMYEQIHILQTQNQKLQDLKETLLPRLMSGEIDVSKLSSIE
ncbi:restriction endonuclease subunit S [Acinetobacter brisouii]